MIELRPIDESNYNECIALKVSEGQQRFVASNVYSLAEAYVYYGECEPMGAYDEETMVGFIMYGFNKEIEKYDIYRVMIDERYQGRGYGREMLKRAILDILQKPDVGEIVLSTENPAAELLYASIGFVRTGEMDGDEWVMALPKARQEEVKAMWLAS